MISFLPSHIYVLYSKDKYSDWNKIKVKSFVETSALVFS